MAGTIGTATVMNYSAPGGSSYTSYRMSWLSDGSGDVSATAVKISGGLLRSVTVIPNTGATQPTNLFDVTLLDADTLDLLGGGGANCVNTGPTMIDMGVVFPGGSVYPTIANAGATKTGELVIVVEN